MADTFHKYLGPILMATYGFLSNTLLTVVCVAVLGNTFSAINADASAESMFRKAVATIEGVKADMVFSYQLPFNLLALVVLYPLSFILSPRWFHKVNGELEWCDFFPYSSVHDPPHQPTCAPCDRRLRPPEVQQRPLVVGAAVRLYRPLSRASVDSQ